MGGATDGLAGQRDFSFRILEPMEWLLRAGTADEIIVDINRRCLEPPTAISGLIIDDLRVE